jgi:hypothetical protein
MLAEHVGASVVMRCAVHLQHESPLWHNDAAFQQEGPQLADRRRSLAQQPVTRAVQAPMSSCVSLLSSTNRVLGRSATSAIASASRPSFFCAFA